LGVVAGPDTGIEGTLQHLTVDVDGANTMLT
jgi:hypothetical protein